MTPNDTLTVLIGTATYVPGTDAAGLAASRGIYRAELNMQTAALTITGVAAELPHPTFLARAPGGAHLYSVSEVDEFAGRPVGAVAAFSVDPAARDLSLLNLQPSGGPGPAYVAVDRTGRLVLVANYGAGSVASLPVDPAGALLPPSRVWQHTGTGPDASRQEAPHAHCIVPDRANRYALCADLGADRILVYPLDPIAGQLGPAAHSVPVRPGMGPRHLAFHPARDVVYASGELDSTVSVFAYDPPTGALTEVQHLSTLPAGFTGENYPSEIAVAPSGRFVYVANRGHDTLAVFAVDPADGRLAPAGHVSVRGAWPRHFALDPTGAWLLVANQESHNVAVFRVDPATGLPAPAGDGARLAAPMFILFW